MVIQRVVDELTGCYSYCSLFHRMLGMKTLLRLVASLLRAVIGAHLEAA